MTEMTIGSLDQLTQQELEVLEDQIHRGLEAVPPYLQEVIAQYMEASRKLHETREFVLESTKSELETKRMETLTDRLSGLSNRRGYERALQEQSYGAVIFIDLDNFGPANKIHGQAAGDAVIKAVADQIRSVIRDTDCAVRYGGDEFLILVEGASLQEGVLVGDRIREKIAKIYVDGYTIKTPDGVTRIQDYKLPEASQDREAVHIYASVGVAHYSRDNVEEMVSAADRAMRQVKQTVKNRTAYVSDDIILLYDGTMDMPLLDAVLDAA